MQIAPHAFGDSKEGYLKKSERVPDHLTSFVPLLESNVPAITNYAFVVLFLIPIMGTFFQYMADTRTDFQLFANFFSRCLCCFLSFLMFCAHLYVRSSLISSEVTIKPFLFKHYLTHQNFMNHPKFRNSADGSVPVFSQFVHWFLLVITVASCISLLFSGTFGYSAGISGTVLVLVFSHLLQVRLFSKEQLTIFWCFPVSSDFSTATRSLLFKESLKTTLHLLAVSIVLVVGVNMIQNWQIFSYFWWFLKTVHFFGSVFSEGAMNFITSLPGMFIICCFVVFLLDLQVYYLRSFIHEKHDFGIKSFTVALNRLRQSSWIAQMPAILVLVRSTQNPPVKMHHNLNFNTNSSIQPSEHYSGTSARRDVADLRPPMKIRFETLQPNPDSDLPKSSLLTRIFKLPRLPSVWDFTPLRSLVRENRKKMLPAHLRPSSEPLVVSAYAAGSGIMRAKGGPVLNTFIHELLFSRDDQIWREFSQSAHRRLSDLNSYFSHFFNLCVLSPGQSLPVFVGSGVRKLVSSKRLSPLETNDSSDTLPTNLCMLPLLPVLEAQKPPNFQEYNILFLELQERLLMFVCLSILYLRALTGFILLATQTLDKRKIVFPQMSSKLLLQISTALHRQTTNIIRTPKRMEFQPVFQQHLLLLQSECETAMAVALQRVGDFDVLSRNAAAVALSFKHV